MKSISGKIWSKHIIEQRFIDKLSQDYDFNTTLSKVLLERNFSNNEIYSINSNEHILNIFKNNIDFEIACKIVEKSCEDKEKILIFGDYDVDGACSTALLINFFKSINQSCDFYIPDRVNDGYGPNIHLLKKLIKQKYKLIIFVDCGTNSYEEIDFLNKKKIKSIIIDHHRLQGKIPNSNSLINPLKGNMYIKYDYFCATTLTFFLIENILLRKKIKKSFKIHDFLILVVLATIADVMPMRKINRNLCNSGLRTFSRKKIKCFNSILDFFKIKRELSFDDLGYLLCPILNSGGRLNYPQLATSLLICNNEGKVEIISKKLIQLNDKRKLIEKNYVEKIINKFQDTNDEVIFVYEPLINEGIIGIIAARLVERFNKPSFVITHSNKSLKGSARSVENFDLGSIIHNAKLNNLILKGGGHKMAAGFTINKDKVNKFKFFLNKQFKKKKIKIDFKYTSQQSLNSVNYLNKDVISKLTPFGNENKNPIFFFEKLKIIKRKIINEKHVLVVFSDSSKKSIEAISFNSYSTSLGNYLLFYKYKVNVLASIKEIFFNNKKKLQLVVHDLII